MKTITLFFGLMLLFIGGFTTTAQDSADLSELAGTSDFVVKLQQEYTSKSDPQEALQLIRTYLPIVQSGDQRHRLLLDMAQLEEQQNQLQSAQLHYQSAAFAPKGDPDYNSLFMSALLLIDFAEYDQALLQCRHVIRESQSEELRLQARLQEARILHLQDKSSAALETLKSLYEQRGSLPAEILYGMHSLYALIYDKESSESAHAAEIARLLQERYPDSPEYGLLRKKIQRKPTPETALGLSSKETDIAAEETADDAPGESSSDAATAETEAEEADAKSRAIQTGSFQDAENAHYMQRELEKLGFTAMVTQAEVNGTSSFRVLVPIAYGETEQEVVLQLKEKGFEGYPIY